MRRLPVALAALLTLTLVAALAAVGLSSTRSARAQAVIEVVGIENLGVDPDANGYVTLDFRGSGIESMVLQCGGAYPQGGTPNLAAQVITRQPEPLLIKLRVFNNQGVAVGANGVRVNCAFDIITPEATTTAQARQPLQGVAARQLALGR